MTPEKQAEIDARMKADYGATRSTVTKNEWVQVSDHCWVCAYWTPSVTERGRPSLYMVHYAASYGAEGCVVYESLANPRKNEVPRDHHFA